ncbi:hypothetical protein P7K49_014134, partial [Saguinus oedipus]
MITTELGRAELQVGFPSNNRLMGAPVAYKVGEDEKPPKDKQVHRSGCNQLESYKDGG